MAKFISHDGVDKNGIRAEVTVMTGTGTISEIVGRGKQNEDGTYRNVEVVFTPDNPMLKRKVYGLLDTTSTELWDYIQKAHESGKNVSYRIESQRRNGVDRTKAIGDLVPTEDVRRILAAIDNHFSHEAKTNPAEDPDNENPSALTQPVQATQQAATAGVSLDDLRRAIAEAIPAAPASATLYAGSGEINFASPAVISAAKAEQFALDHLVTIYTPAKAKTSVDVSDEMVAQAGALALQLLTIADAAHQEAVAVGGGTSDPAVSKGLALNLVIDAVDKRHPAPLGTDEAKQTEWADTVATEAADRLYAISLLAQGRAPQPRPAAPTPPSEIEVEPESTFVDAIVPFSPSVPLLDEGAAGYIAPGDDLINRVRVLCESAQVLNHPKEISDWMEAVLGVRSARKVHAPVLAEFCDYYEQSGPMTVRTEVISHLAA